MSAARPRSGLERLAWISLGYTLLVILWGAFVRATGSGAGCGAHWPTCHGEVVPRPESMETFIELTHRLTSGLSLILVVAVAVVAFRVRERGHPVRTAAVASVIFMVLEAAIGAGIVLLELVADNRSSARAAWVALHLVNTFLLVAVMTLTARFAAPDARAPSLEGQRGVLAWLGALAIGTLVVGATGAITALGDTLFPVASLAEGIAADRAPDAHFLVKLRVWHPISAVVLGVAAVGISGLLAITRPSPGVRRAALGVTLLFVAQLAAGLVNLLLLAPVWMQLVHLALADLLWIALVLLSVEAVAAPRAVSSAAREPGLKDPLAPRI